MLDKLSKREKVLLFVMLITGLVALFSQYVLLPTLHDSQKIKEEIEQKNTLFREAKAVAATRSIEQEKSNKAQLTWQETMNKFGTDMQDGLFLVHFSRELEKEQVQIDVFAPQEIEDKKVLLVLPVELELAGYYPQVVRILDFLENQANLTEIRYLILGGSKIEFNENQSMSFPDGWVKAKCLLLIYSQPTPQGKLVLDDIKNWRFGKMNPFEGEVARELKGLREAINFQKKATQLNKIDPDNNYQWLQQPPPVPQSKQTWLPPVAVTDKTVDQKQNEDTTGQWIPVWPKEKR